MSSTLASGGSIGTGIHDEYDIQSSLLRDHYTKTWDNPELLEQAGPSCHGYIFRFGDFYSINSVHLIRSRGLAV
jgi:hypothetical protein